MSLRLAVLASGTGSLFASMLEHKLDIQLLVTDRPCHALEIAEEAGIPCQCIPRTFRRDFDREGYTFRMLELLCEHNIGLVAMAGFMTVFSPLMFTWGNYQSKILNTHPSLLPSFKGEHAVRDALDYGVKITGCTIHWATEELDAGPILTQEAVKVLPGDTVESLHERIKVVERELYPALLKLLTD
jgi:phosphoribosylglycinamide formyltransferase-1